MSVAVRGVSNMSVVYARSPIVINFYTNLVGATITLLGADIKIWVGDKVSDKPSVSTFKVNLDVNSLPSDLTSYDLDISELIRGYLNTDNFNGTYGNDWAVFVEVNWGATDSFFNEAVGTVNFMAVNGFQKYTDADNLAKGFHYPASVVNVPKNQTYTLTLLDLEVSGASRDWDTINITYDSGEVETFNLGSVGSTTASLFKTYDIVLGSYYRFEDRVLAAGGTFEGGCLSDSPYLNCAGEAVVSIVYEDAEVASFKVVANSKAKYNNYQLGYVNKNGVIDYLALLGVDKENQSVKRNNYKPVLNSSFNKLNAQYRVLNANGRARLTLNTDWVDESNGERIRELLLTEYSVLDGRAVNISTPSSEIKKSVDQLINYTIEVEEAYDTINSVR